LGPLISAEQRKEVLSFLEPDSTGGAKALHHGQVTLPERGYYVSPAVFSRVPADSRIAKEEVFGPVLSIFAVDSDAQAIELANDTIYGLSGAIWSDSQEHALSVSTQIRTGQIDINGASFNPEAPFGGYKQSGIGREIGKYGIEDVLELKAVQI
jgi:aldehyde dehydrogenase (NAD+)